MDYAIKGGLVVTEHGVRQADIGIDKGKIVALASPDNLPSSEKIIDATDKYVLPGLIDLHTHHGFVEPFAQTCLTETRASLLGGVTTVGLYTRFPGTKERGVELVFEEHKNDFETNAVTDGIFHLMVLGEIALKEIPTYRKLGVHGFKYLMGYKGPQAELIGVPPGGIDDGFVYEGFRTISRLEGSVRAMVHAENIDIAMRLGSQLRHRQDVRVWHDSRPNFVEEECIRRALFLARTAKCPLYVVHNTIGEAVEIFARAKAEGVDVIAETCPQYLTHNSEDPVPEILANPTFANVNPPLRGKADNEKLWQAIRDGVIDVIGSDQAPQTKASKGKDMWKAGMGVGNITQMILPVMLSEGVNKNRITIEKVVEICCYNPTRVFGLYPRKGAIDIGSDADIVVVDLEKQVRWTCALSPSICDWNIYEGWLFKGFPVLTMLRGEVVMENGTVLAKPGYGKYIGE